MPNNFIDFHASKDVFVPIWYENYESNSLTLIKDH